MTTKISILRSVDTARPIKHGHLTEKQIQALKTTAGVILGLAAIASVVALAVIAPNALQILGKKSGKKWQSQEFRAKQKQRISKTLYYLRKRGDIELIPSGNDFTLKITQKGRKKIKKLQFETLEIPKAPSWNHRWWLVLADIPSKLYRRRADFFRDKVKQLGFYSLQRTVWVYPFDPRDEVDFVSSFYNIEKFVTTMEVSKLDLDDEKTIYAFFKEKQIL